MGAALAGGLRGAGDALDVCDRLIFFCGGCSDAGVVEGGERCDEDRELFGSWMPSIGSDSDFLLVL